MRQKNYLMRHKSQEGQRKVTRSLMLDRSVNKLITFLLVKYNCDSRFTALRHLAWEKLFCPLKLSNVTLMSSLRSASQPSINN